MKLFEDNGRSAIIKRLMILLGVILIVFATINVIWFLGYQQRYDYISEHLDATYIDGIEEKDLLIP